MLMELNRYRFCVLNFELVFFVFIWVFVRFVVMLMELK